MSLKSLFWKRIDLKKQEINPKIEPGQQLTYLTDINKYLFFGGLEQQKQNHNKNQSNDKEKLDNKNNQQGDGTPNSQKSGGIKFSLGAKPSFNLGGQQKSGGLKFSITNSTANNNTQDFVYILDPAEYTWKEQICSGKIPTKRVNFFSWYEAPYYFIYGGEGVNGKILNDMYVLNIENWEWKRFFWLDGPQPKADSQLVNMGVNKYLIGGASMPENWVYNQVWMFHFENVVWNTSGNELPGIYWEQIEIQNDEDFKPLKAFSAVKVSESQIYIFGGYNQNKQCTDTSILLDVESQTISEFETKGTKPSPRAYHKMLPVKDNLVCLFGGVSCPEDAIKGPTSTMLNDFYILNLKEGYFTRPNVGGYQPSSRYNFAMAGNQSEMASEIMLLGGKSSENLCDKYIYILGEMIKDEKEYWGERDLSSKQQFEEYRVALKNNKKKKEELNNVSLLTLEFSQAEKIMNEDKRKIAELEILLKKLRNENEQNNQNLQKYKIQQQKKNQEHIITKQNYEIESQQIAQKNNELQDFVGQISTLLAYERKRRKLHSLKSFQLQDCLRKAENLIITIDSVYSKGQKDDLIEGVLTDDAIKKIDRKKKEHKKQLSVFKEDFELIYENEKKIKKEAKEKKNNLKQSKIMVSQQWKNFLSPEEQRMFQVKFEGYGTPKNGKK